MDEDHFEQFQDELLQFIRRGGWMPEVSAKGCASMAVFITALAFASKGKRHDALTHIMAGMISYLKELESRGITRKPN